MKFSRSDYNKRIVDLDNKIPEDEPVFLLRSTDKLAPKLLLQWAQELRLNGGDPNVARSAEDHAQEMIRYQNEHGCKTPDSIMESSEHRFIKDKIREILNSKGRINLKDLTKWINELSGNDSKVLKVLVPFDLRLGAISKSISELNLDDFTLTDDMMLEVHRASLVIFIDHQGKGLVIKNELC